MRFQSWKRSVLFMETRIQPARSVAELLKENDRDCAWLSRTTGIPYKRVLAEVKHERAPMLAVNAVLYADTLGVEVPDLMPRIEKA